MRLGDSSGQTLSFRKEYYVREIFKKIWILWTSSVF